MRLTIDVDASNSLGPWACPVESRREQKKQWRGGGGEMRRGCLARLIVDELCPAAPSGLWRADALALLVLVSVFCMLPLTQAKIKSSTSSSLGSCSTFYVRR
jgi:hypothetical protein